MLLRLNLGALSVITLFCLSLIPASYRQPSLVEVSDATTPTLYDLPSAPVRADASYSLVSVAAGIVVTVTTSSTDSPHGNDRQSAVPVTSAQTYSPPSGACGVPTGGRLAIPAALELINRYDWSPATPAQMLAIFTRESQLYVNIVSCTRDYGWTQLNEVHRTDVIQCDLNRVLVDPEYAIDCSHRLFLIQGLEAWRVK